MNFKWRKNYKRNKLQRYKYLKLELMTDEIDPEPDEELESPVDGGLTERNRFTLGLADTGKDAILLTPFEESRWLSFDLLVISTSGKCLFPSII